MKGRKIILTGLSVLMVLSPLGMTSALATPASEELLDYPNEGESVLALELEEGLEPDRLDSQLSFDFSDLSFEALMTAISDELLEILSHLGFEFDTLADFEQLLNLEEAVWDYLQMQSDEIFMEFYYLLQDLKLESNELQNNPVEDPSEQTELDEIAPGEASEETNETVTEKEPEEVDEITEQVEIDVPNLDIQQIGIQVTGAEITPMNATTNTTTNATINVAAITTVRRTGVTIANHVNFRRGSGNNYNLISRIPINIDVRITGRRGNWYRIVHNGTTGWVARSQIARTRQMAVVTGNRVPVRNADSDRGRILTRAARGTHVIINERTARWAQVTVNGRTGWIRANQLSITNGRRPARTRGQVNLHARPHASSAVRRRLPRHQEMMVIQRTTTGWSQVTIRHNGGTQMGWMRSNQVQNRAQSRQARGSGHIPVRTGAGNRFRIARRIPRNTPISVLAESGSWSHISFRHNGRRHRGWVPNSRLTRISRLPQARNRNQTSNQNQSNQTSQGGNQTNLTRAQAIERARAHLNSIGIRNATFVYAYLDWENGVRVWSIEFRYNRRDLEFYVAVSDGRFLKAPRR